MRLPCLLAVAALLVACPKSTPSAPEAGTVVEAGAAADASGGGSDRTEDDDVRPVYPVDGVEPHGVAVKLCAALHELPEKRRSACCSEPPGISVTKECVRMLSASMRAAAVTVEAAQVDACALAMTKAYEGCDWVGPFPPALPPECLSIVKGALAAKARCRSSLECAGDLRCHGVGPTTAGRCGPARDDGGACGGTVDTLATFVRQTDTDESHPECKGFCSRTKCATPGPEGTACALTRECAAGLQCLGTTKNAPLLAKTGKCAPHAPDKLGQPCPGQVCERGLMCLGGTCVARKPAGAVCTTDFECVGGCIKGDAGAPPGKMGADKPLEKGRCGQKCGAR